jgi:hypothetical protein
MLSRESQPSLSILYLKQTRPVWLRRRLWFMRLSKTVLFELVIGVNWLDAKLQGSPDYPRLSLRPRTENIFDDHGYLLPFAYY